MPYGIAAIQYLYGVNPNTHKEDDVHTSMDGADAAPALWDAGGDNDTVDASGQSVTIDLNPGQFSFVGKNEAASPSPIAIAFQPAGY